MICDLRWFSTEQWDETIGDWLNEGVENPIFTYYGLKNQGGFK